MSGETVEPRDCVTRLTPESGTSSQRRTTDNNNGDGDKAGGHDVRKRRRHHSRESEVSIDSMEEYIPSPPDGGWGWVIVASSMVCNLIVDGISYSFGVFLLEFVDAFKEPKSKVSLVGSLLSGIYLFAGPIVSAMTNRFGCRPVVIVGSCISTVAFVLATLSPNIEVLIITYGVIGGFGLGMIYLPSIVSVGYYFEKKRAFATGLAVCGSGVGTFMFPPLSEYLLKEFSWQGGLLIIAGIIFHGCICGVLMRPLEAKPVRLKKTPREKNLLDRLKETTKRDRAMSESSGMNTKIREGVHEAKLERQEKLQDTDSDLGSLSSVTFAKRSDNVSQADHKRFTTGIPIPGAEARRPKLSNASSYTAESAGSPVRYTSASPTSPALGSPSSVTPKSIFGAERSDTASHVRDGQISPDPESETNGSETTPDAISTDRSEYFTPPDTNHNSPVKSVNDGSLATSPVKDSNVPHSDSEGSNPLPNVVKSANEDGTGGDSADKRVDSTESKRRQRKSTDQFISEFAPLLEVPAPRIHNGAVKTIGYGGSRTNMTHLTSLRSLHVSKKDLARPLYRKDIFYSGSVLNIQQFQSQPDMKSYIASITTIPGEMDFVEAPSSSSKCINSWCSCLPRSARDILSEMADISLLKDISFMLICLGNILAFLGFFIPFVFLVDRAVSMNIDKSKAAFLISIIGITNTVGRVLVGKLADMRLVDSLVITYMSITLCGVVTFLIPFCNTYNLLATAAAVFGLGVAAFISLSSIIICDRMGLEKLTNAFGLLSMVRGISGMIGPPLAGFMYDTFGSYDLSFFLGGILLLLGAVCHVFLHLPCLRPKLQPNRQIQEQEIGELQDSMGSKPQLVTIEEAMSTV